MSNIFVSHSSLDRAEAEEVVEQLRRMGHEALFLDTDAKDGIPAGQEWEHTLYVRLRACRAVVVIHSANWQASRWGFVEAAYARTLGKHIFPVLIDDQPIDGLLADRQAIDLRSMPEGGYARLQDGLRRAGLDPRDSFRWSGDRSPFPGLDAFDEDYAAVFFGRDEEIGSGLDPLNRVRRGGASAVMMVMGPSGSGKSSLVRAGLIPRLRRDPNRWIVVDPIRPLDDPTRELSAALARSLDDVGVQRTWEEILDELRTAQLQVDSPAAQRDEIRGTGPQGLGYLGASNPLVDIAYELRAESGRSDAGVILTVDQFEELLAHPDEQPDSAAPAAPPGKAEDSARFLAVVRDAVERERSPIVVLGTMRSDFLDAFQAQPALLGLEYIALFIGPMAAGDIADVIRRPAELSGIEVDDDLVQQMVADATSNDNALPLLAFTLRELHDRCGDDMRLELSEYREALGGLDGAIARTAERIVASRQLTDDELSQLRQAFLAMVRLADEGRYAKQIAALEDLDTSVATVLDDFRDARLLVKRLDTDGNTTYEVRHDAIFRSWTRLATWLDEFHDELRLRSDLDAAAKQWIDGGRKPDRLWTDARVDRAKELIAARRLTLAPQTGEFVTAAGRRRDRRRRRIVIGSVSFAAAMLVLAGVAVAASRAASTSAQLARSRAVAALALGTVDERPDLAFLLGLESLRLGDTREARDAVFSLRRLSPAAAYLRGHSAVVEEVAWDERSNTLASVDASGVLTLWNVVGMKPAAQRDTDVRANAVALANDGAAVAIGTDDGALIWDLTMAGPMALEGAPVVIAHGDPVTALAFDPSGEILATAASDFVIRLFDARNGQPLDHPDFSHGDIIRGVSFDPSGASILSASNDGDARLWNLATGDSTVLPHPAPVRDISMSQDGSLIATAADDHQVRLWSLDEPESPVVLAGHTSRVRSVDFSGGGDQLVSGGEDQAVIVWDSASGAVITRLDGHRGLVASVAFGPGSQVASAGSDGTVILWELSNTARRAFAEHALSVRDLAFTDDGGLLVSVGEAGEVVVRDVDEGQVAQTLLGLDGINAVAIRPDSAIIATSGEDPGIRLWRVQDLASVGEFSGHTGRVWSLSFSTDGRRLASAGSDGRVIVSEPGSRSQTTVHAANHAVRSVAFGGTSMLAWGADDGGVTVFDLATASPVHILSEHERQVWAVEFSPGLSWLAAAGNDEVVMVWSVETGDLVAELGGATQSLRDVAFDPTGAMVAAVGQDGSILIWETGTWRLVDRIENQTGRLWAVAFHPTQKLLASGGVDGAAVLWDVDLEQAVRSACATSRRNMTLEEWNLFVGDGEYMRHCDAYPPGTGAPPEASMARYPSLNN